MSISAALASFEWQERKVNLIDTPGELELRRRRARRAARVRVGGVRRQRRDGRRGLTRSRLWQRAAELDLARLVFVNMLDRERADFFRTLDSLKAAFGPHVVATEIPIGSEHEVSRRDRPRRHEGLRVRRRRAATTARRSRSPTSWPTQAAGVPREADGRGRRELRRADGALPRGRGDLPRGDRHRAQGRHQPRRACSRSPAASRPATSAPTACSTRSSRTCPRRSSTAASRSAR